MNASIKNIVIFASGNGSNAKALYFHFAQHEHIKIVAVFCNNANAGIIAFANEKNIPLCLFSKKEFIENSFLEKINAYHPSLLVLAGFLWMIPSYLIKHYPNKIINIHPSLLPKYGGKGMYGHYVHEAVIANHETESGITIHLVNEEYDKGKILLQKSLPILPNYTAEILANKVLALEHAWFKIAIENYLQ